MTQSIKYYTSKIYFALLCMLVIFLPYSNFMVSLSIIILSANWLVERIFNKNNWQFKINVCMLLLMSIYALHIIALIYTDNFSYAFHDLRIKLPLLLIPLIIGSSEKLQKYKVHTVLFFFISSVFFSSIVCYTFFDALLEPNSLDARDLSIFINHIRYSLMINLAIFSSLFLLFHLKNHNHFVNIYLMITSGWLIYFLFILQSYTGIIIFIFCCLFLFIYLIYQSSKIFVKTLFTILFASFFLIIIYFIITTIHNYYPKVQYEKTLDMLTINGNKYIHFYHLKDLENGNYVWRHICEKELSKAWNKRSSLDFNEKDRQNQDIKYTLIRYLTSKGLRKDSVGVSQLNEDDINKIENGITNYLYNVRNKSINSILYQLIWEIDHYVKGKNPSGSSVTQRLEYLKISWQIIRNNFWIGVGTGDVEAAFDKEYKNSETKLTKEFQLRAHNQFITFFITFGIFGFIWILYVFIKIYLHNSKIHKPLFMIFYLLSILSFLNEDTLETHIGVTFFAFFISLFLFNQDKYNE